MTITFPGESQEYRTARDRLLAKEIELRRAMEAVAMARRELPPGGVVPTDYVFDSPGADGKPTKVRLSELFAPGRDSLLIYSFMFPRHPADDRPAATEGVTAGLRREDGPCPSCTALLDQLDGTVEHLEAAGFNFAVVAKAPIDRVLAFAGERGWRRLHLLSAGGNDFKRDYRAETPEGHQMPIMTVFHRGADGAIRHFWSSEMLYAPTDPGQDPRDLGTIEPLWTMMDLTRDGRPAGYIELLEYACCE